MFGFIKKLFAGMLGFFGGLFGSNKTESTAPKIRKGKGYFLELDDTAATETGNGDRAATAQPAKTPALAATAQPAKTESAPAPKAEPAKTPAPAAKTPAPAATAQPAKAEPAPAKAEPAKALAPAKAAKENDRPQSEQTFAPNYLLTLSSTNGRRRPGANMNPFLDMARQVKPSS